MVPISAFCLSSSFFMLVRYLVQYSLILPYLLSPIFC